MQIKYLTTLVVLLVALIATSCNDESNSAETQLSNNSSSESQASSSSENKGIGPVQELMLGDINQALVSEGKDIYDKKCTACHNINAKLIGPPQAGVLERRTPEWVMNMILNPTEMIKKDPIAMALLKEFNNVPMTEQGLTEQDARAILEYFRTI